MPTAQRILDIAEDLVRTRGFNAFSYADIAEAMDITKASLHYHFASKAELGARLIARYETKFMAELNAVTEEYADARERVRHYVGIWLDLLRSGQMHFGIILAAEFSTLPPHVALALKSFMFKHEAWLTEVLEDGRNRGELSFDGAAGDMAGLVIGALAGTMTRARAYGEVERFTGSIGRMLDWLGVAWEAKVAAVLRGWAWFAVTGATLVAAA